MPNSVSVDTCSLYYTCAESLVFFGGAELFLVDDPEPLIHVVLEDFVVRVAGQQVVPGAGGSGERDYRQSNGSRRQAGNRANCPTLSECAFRIALDATLHSQAFDLGFDQFDAGHEIAPESVDLEGRPVSHEAVDLRFVQSGDDVHAVCAPCLELEEKSNINF